MKRVLIISPYFPPTNAADMHRVRSSLPYFEENGWLAEVVMVGEKHSDMVKDTLLLSSIPHHIKVHRVAALSKKWTSKIGLGSIALRSLFYYRRYVNKLLQKEQFDLIYFSTTQFPVLILGAYWKKKFGIRYVIDMQDPWHSDYYQDKPKNERPKKYWFSYRLNKFLEPIAMKKVDGLISVSDAYIKALKLRYSVIKDIPEAVIPFPANEKDFEITAKNATALKIHFPKKEENIHLVYIGRAGNDMAKSIRLLFHAFKNGLDKQPALFEKLRFHFIGTSYAAMGLGVKTIEPIAQELGVEAFVMENTNRIPYYDNLHTLTQADALLIPGSDDHGYTASKVFPYILAKKPLLAIFNTSSSTYRILQECNAAILASLNEKTEALQIIEKFLTDLIDKRIEKPNTNWDNFIPYTAKLNTQKQCALFNLLTKE
ncbi:glycosyltransferase [Pedobacter sp. MW01-1-1]|uniref:glycosyltransferase n=1 Tax=Pedobacter sp. MW01-1-1 TaxID=3383027 RepID=UPI003FEE6C65